MIIKNGQVIAIDQVLHDSTLSGDGRTVPLGVVSGGSQPPVYGAGEWVSLSASDKKTDWTKMGGNNLDYTKLSGTYKVTTQIVTSPKTATPELTEATVTINNKAYKFTIDAYSPTQWHTFDNIIDVTGKLTTTYQIDSDINFSAYQYINSLVSTVVSGGVTPGINEVYVNAPLTGNGTEAQPVGLQDNYAMTATYSQDDHNIVFDWA